MPLVSGSEPNVATPQKPAAEPPERPSTTRVIRKIGGSFTPSIKNALAGNPETEKAEATEQKSIFSNYAKSDEPFTRDQLIATWNKYLETISDKPNLKSTLSPGPEVDGSTLLLKIGNSVQEEEVRQVKPDLVNWLRTELKNSEIELITRIERIETERVIFSDSEKLKIMIEKNPELLELRQRFNLDFKD